MLVEEKFNSNDIENVYKLGEAALTLSKTAMALIENSSTIASVKLAVQPVKEYRDFKEALNEANNTKFELMSNIVRNYLNDVKTEIEEGAIGLKASIAKETADEIIDAALVYQDIFDANGNIFNLIGRNILGYEIEPTYGDDVMLTEELMALRDEVITNEEVRDENDELINNLYAVTYYVEEGFKKAASLIIENNSGDELYTAISYLDEDGNNTRLADFADMAKKDFSNSIIPQEVALNSSLSAEQNTKLATLLRNKVEDLKDESYASLIDYKTGVKTADETNEKLNAIENDLNNVESIQNDLLDALQRVNLTTTRTILSDVRELIN